MKLHASYMNERSLPRFNASPDRVDPVTVDVARVVHATAVRMGIDFFLCGATARDVILNGIFGFTPGRATMDLDFGVALESWEEFDKLKTALVATGKFAASAKVKQRLESLAHNRRIVDLIPFGGIESPQGMVVWPPEKDAMLNVAGFADALSSAISVRLADDFAIPVASIAGLTILKMLAWADRRRMNNKDAEDLSELLQHYAASGNEERLYTTEIAHLERTEFDLDLAGARLLGADTALVATADTAARILQILAAVLDTDSTAHELTTRTENQFAALLLSFREGFLELHQGRAVSPGT